MKNRWNDNAVKQFKNDLLALRVYTSRLLGEESVLVLQGGGNTSVKITVKNLFGDSEEILYVKGSGWDLATIEKAGFAPVKLDLLKRMAELKNLTDTVMVKTQRAAMIDPGAPTPSVEAILHAIIPFTFVDHTHADSVVAISNTKDGERRIRDIYGPKVLVVPYVMPGFILAKKIFEMTRNINWQNIEGMILLNHGVFTFANDARTSYTQMIRLVTKAEKYLKRKKATLNFPAAKAKEDLPQLARTRRIISKLRGAAVIAQFSSTAREVYFSNHPKATAIATRGPLTPDHVIRTKRVPLIIGKNIEQDIKNFSENYHKYFKRHATAGLRPLDPAPRWAVWPGYGTISFGTTLSETRVISDITEHTIDAVLHAEKLGGWQALPEKDIFEVEYWELEQAKLNKAGKAPIHQGKIALVTGAASGIGKACAETLASQGAVVMALDINPAVTKMFNAPGVCGMVCDVTKPAEVERAVNETIRRFGGLDILISNAGIFPPSASIDNIDSTTWNKSLEINLTSHQNLLKTCIPYLSLGIDPAVVIIASKNVPAPGPGAAAYSVAKAGLTQLARVAALELAPKGIRVNVLHPNQVFDTAIWTPEVLKKRSEHYKMSVDEYKTSNLLKTEITSKDVANLASVMAGPIFAKTTGAQIPIDGGNERVI